MRLTGANTLQIDALTSHLNGATWMSHRWLQEKPSPSQMHSEFDAWYEETRTCVEKIGGSYAADLQAALLRSLPRVTYPGSGFDADQEGLLSRLDALIECVQDLLRQLRAPTARS